MKLASLALVMCGALSATPVNPPSTLEQEMVAFANTASKSKLRKAIKLGWEKTNFTNALVDQEVQNVVANRPYSSLEQLYNVTILGPESMEGLERYLKLKSPGLQSPTLKFVNKKETSANVLVKNVGVDAKAAVKIWETRKAGPDHQLGTSDDRWMEFKFIYGENYVHHLRNQRHVHSLDEVEGVGPATIQKIVDYCALSAN